MWRLLRDGLRVGIALTIVWTAVWAVIIGVQSPAPELFLDRIYEPPRVACPPEVERTAATFFGLRECARCPMFVLRDRGLAWPGDHLTLVATLLCWPALRIAAAPANGFCGVLLVDPGAFSINLALQWLLGGFAIVATTRAITAIRRGAGGRRTRG
jgi:hypothetical protein